MIAEILFLLALLLGRGESSPAVAGPIVREIQSAPALPAAYRKREYRPPGEFQQRLLPYETWDEQDRRLFANLYGDPSTVLEPRALVLHYSTTEWPESVWNGFLAGATMWDGEKFFHGHPSVHLVLDKDGTVYQLLPLDRRGTGAYGVDHVALSIEMVARDEKDLLSRPDQVFASFCLVRSLMERFDIPAERVWGHNEVGRGPSVVPEYRDLMAEDPRAGYPPEAGRIDPGERYMKLLRGWLAQEGLAPG